LENDEEWLVYDDEKTEVLVEMGDTIYETLIMETVDWLMKILHPPIQTDVAEKPQ